MEKRYAAMEEIAKAGIVTGLSLISIPAAQRSGMPIMPDLPFRGDTDENLEATIRATANHGGRFVVAGGLTLADRQREYFFGVLRDRFPDVMLLYERMYPHPTATYGGITSGDPHALGRRIRELCKQYGIVDRMPRPIIPGDKRALLRQAHRRSPGQPVLPAGAGHPCRTRLGCRQRAGAARLGVPQGGVGDRGALAWSRTWG